MECPKCLKHKFFIVEDNSSICLCRKCGYKAKFKQPNYRDYHKKNYAYRIKRTSFNDPIFRHILKNMNINPDHKVLDYGCGAGDYSAALSKHSKSVVGLDIDIKRAREKFPKNRFIRQKGKKLKFKNDHFDRIVCVNTVEHVVSFENLMKEFKRVLKPGGKIFLTTYDTDFIFNEILYDNTHVYEWNNKEFYKFVSKFFVIEKTFRSGGFFNFFPLNWIIVFFLKPEICVVGRKNY